LRPVGSGLTSRSEPTQLTNVVTRKRERLGEQFNKPQENPSLERGEASRRNRTIDCDVAKGVQCAHDRPRLLFPATGFFGGF
jgi:hypothetical protein